MRRLIRPCDTLPRHASGRDGWAAMRFLPGTRAGSWRGGRRLDLPRADRRAG